MSTVKDALKELAERLPDDATWDDVMYQIHVCQKIEAGLADIAAGRVHTSEEVFKPYRAMD